MTTLGSLFHEHATFVYCFGYYLSGDNAVITLHTPIHETTYSDSTLDNEAIDVIPIAEGATVVHFWSRLTAGRAHPRRSAFGRYSDPCSAPSSRRLVANQGARKRDADQSPDRRGGIARPGQCRRLSQAAHHIGPRYKRQRWLHLRSIVPIVSREGEPPPAAISSSTQRCLGVRVSFGRTGTT